MSWKPVRFGMFVSGSLLAGMVSVAAEGQTVDVLTIGTVNVMSGTGQVKVPIYLQDNLGTAIGRDKAAGARITGFALQVTYGPGTCIDTPATANARIDLAGGILQAQSADVESRPKIAGISQSWIYSSAEANGLIPFTAAPSPGDRIGAMTFDLTACPAGTIDLVVTTSGGAAAALNSDGGTSEMVGSGLAVVNGAIVVHAGYKFYAITPCRIFDTRNSSGPDAASPALAPGLARIFDTSGRCGIPASAQSLSVNVTVTGPTTLGFVTVFPGDGTWPLASTINFMAGQTRANNAVIRLATDGSGKVGVLCGSTGTVDLILDVNGFFQ